MYFGLGKICMQPSLNTLKNKCKFTPKYVAVELPPVVMVVMDDTRLKKKITKFFSGLKMEPEWHSLLLPPLLM